MLVTHLVPEGLSNPCQVCHLQLCMRPTSSCAVQALLLVWSMLKDSQVCMDVTAGKQRHFIKASSICLIGSTRSTSE